REAPPASALHATTGRLPCSIPYEKAFGVLCRCHQCQDVLESETTTRAVATRQLAGTRADHLRGPPRCPGNTTPVCLPRSPDPQNVGIHALGIALDLPALIRYV